MMKLPLFRFLLIGELVVLCLAMICLDNFCDPTGGVEKCLGEFGSNQYVRLKFSRTKETYILKRSFLCDVMCFRRGCLCNLYLPGGICILAFSDDSFAAAPGSVLRRFGTHWAAPKRLSSSTVFNGLGPELAIDRDLVTMFRAVERNPVHNWFQIDLLTPQVIRAIRIIGRQEAARLYHFKEIEIYVSDEDAATTGIESGKLVSNVTYQPPSLDYWWNVILEDSQDAHRYLIVVRKQIGDDKNRIEIPEIELFM